MSMERPVGAIESSGSLEGERFVLHSRTAFAMNGRLYWFILALFIFGPLLALLLLRESFRGSLSRKRTDGVWELELGPTTLRLWHRQGGRFTLRGVPQRVREAYARHGALSIPWPEDTNVMVMGHARQPTLVIETIRGPVSLDLHVNEQSQRWLEGLNETLNRRAGGLLSVNEVPDALHELRGRPSVQA